jgi:hypothetical protein
MVLPGRAGLPESCWRSGTAEVVGDQGTLVEAAVIFHNVHILAVRIGSPCTIPPFLRPSLTGYDIMQNIFMRRSLRVPNCTWHLA